MYIEERKFNRINLLLEQYDDMHIQSMKQLRRQMRYCMQENAGYCRTAEMGIPWERHIQQPAFYESEECEECEERYDLCQLIDSLVTDIIHLEEETVKWREALIPYLSMEDAEGLRSDIFSDLARRHTGEETYELYMRTCCIKTDRLEASDHLNRMKRLKDGADDDTVRF